MNTLYLLIDKIWQKLSETIFLRFDFEIPSEDVKEQVKKGKLVFITNQGGFIEWLILSSWSRKNGLGAILISNRKRTLLFSKPLLFVKLIFKKVSYADLFLSKETGPRLLFCPTSERKRLFVPTRAEKVLGRIDEKLQVEKADVAFAPVLFVWRKHTRGGRRSIAEYLFGLSSNPNLIGKFWYLLRKREDSLVLSLTWLKLEQSQEAPDAWEENPGAWRAKHLRRQVFVQLQQELRIRLGPKKISPHLVKENILRDPEMADFIEKMSQDDNIDSRKLLAEAYRYLGEIAANYTFRTVEFLHFVLNFVFNRILEGVHVKDEDFELVRREMKDKSVIFVSAHRSHLDYLLLPYILFEKDMAVPHIVAGINMDFWPLGGVMRKAGAFFIRRSFRGNKLYGFCLRKYVESLLKSRQNIAFFIEGTRSRSGKMLPPAYGILKILLERFDQKILDDIAFIPVALCYDRIPEERAYSSEIKGGKKDKESFFSFLKVRKLIGRNFGGVYLRVDEPFYAKEIFETAAQQNWSETERLQQSAFQMSRSICHITPITPKSVLSTLFISHPLASIPSTEVRQLSQTLVGFASHMHFSFSIEELSLWPHQTSLLLDSMVKDHTLSRHLQEEGEYFSIETRKRPLLNYYKNNSIHCFKLQAIYFLSLFETLRSTEAHSPDFKNRWDENALKIRNLLKFEFFFSSKKVFTQEMKQAGNFFFKDAPEKGNKELFSMMGEAVSWNLMSLSIRILGDIVESYSLVLEYLTQKVAFEMEKKSLVSSILRFAEEKKNHGQIRFAEAVSVQNFSNACLLLDNLKLLPSKKVEQQTLVHFEGWNEEWEDLAMSFSSYLHLMDWNLKRLVKK